MEPAKMDGTLPGDDGKTNCNPGWEEGQLASSLPLQTSSRVKAMDARLEEGRAGPREHLKEEKCQSQRTEAEGPDQKAEKKDEK